MLSVYWTTAWIRVSYLTCESVCRREVRIWLPTLQARGGGIISFTLSMPSESSI